MAAVFCFFGVFFFSSSIYISVYVFRKSSARAIEELQRTLIEIETRYKTEISRLKKKYETDIRELESALDTANRQNAEHVKVIKSLHIKIKVRIFFNPVKGVCVYWECKPRKLTLHKHQKFRWAEYKYSYVAIVKVFDDSYHLE